MIDGSTDVSVKEQKIVYVKMLKGGRAVTCFLGLIQLRSGDANGILAGLKSFFLEFNLENWNSKVVGLGTDGASVNLGSRYHSEETHHYEELSEPKLDKQYLSSG